MSKTRTSVPTIETFDFNRFKISQTGNTNSKYKFTKYSFEYDFGVVSARNCIVKLSGLRVAKIYSPQNEGSRYTVIFNVDDDEQVKFLNSIQDHVQNHVFEHQSKYGVELEDEGDLKDSFPNVLCRHNSQYNSNSLLVSFPFDEKNSKSVDITYYEDELDDDITSSSDLIKRLGQSSTCDVFLELEDLKRDDETQQFNIRTTLFGKINIQTYSNEASSGGSGIYPQMSLMDVDLNNLKTGEPDSNQYNSKFTKPLYNMDGKDKALVCSFENTTVSFLTTTSPDSGKLQFNIVMNLDDDTANKFDEIGNHLFDNIYDNHKKYIGKDKPSKRKAFDAKIKHCVKRSDNYGTNIWFSVYAREKKNEPGRFEFDNKFYRTDGTQYTDDEVQDQIFGLRDQPVELLNVFYKHIWFGKFYSDKWQLSGVKLDVNNVEFELDGPEPPSHEEVTNNSDNTSDDGTDSDNEQTTKSDGDNDDEDNNGSSSQSSSDDDGSDSDSD